ncbi:MAG: cobalamin biosynthesis protein, partial [Desulfobulbaceae bacterium]|nr:cobalamin biosynthesis protein [Desulfobulbaceae bacterium]
AAVAGALGIRLGGPSNYFGKPVNKPTIGDPLNPVLPSHILQTNQLMLISTFLGALLFLTTRILISTFA